MHLVGTPNYYKSIAKFQSLRHNFCRFGRCRGGYVWPPPFYTSTTFASCIYCLTLIFHYLSSKYGGLYKTSTGEIVYFIFKNFRIGRGSNKSMYGWPPPKIILHDICLLDHSKWWGTGMMPIQFFRTIAAKKSCFHFLRKYVH